MQPKIFKTIIFVAVVAVIGIGAYYYFFISPQSKSLLGGDADSHDCLGSAGYTWCESKGKCIRIFEEFCRDESDNIVQGLNGETKFNLEFKEDKKFLWFVGEGETVADTYVTGAMYETVVKDMEEYLKLEEHMNTNYEINSYQNLDVIQGSVRGYYIDYMACALNYRYPAMAGETPETMVPTTDEIVIFIDCGYFNKNDIPRLIAQQLIKELLAETHDKDIKEVYVELTRFQDNYASGTVAFTDEEMTVQGLILARKVDGNWTVSYEGNGSIDCADLRENQGFPDEILKPNFCD